MMESSANLKRRNKGISFFNYLQSELRRGYLLENDEERYAARREKVYTFFKIPRELEKFLVYGFFQSADSFLFVMTFLPIRFMLALWCMVIRPLKQIFGFGRNMVRFMKPAEIVDLLKGSLLIVCCYLISYIDTSVCYHMIKTQSTIKLYLFFNMLEIADRLMSAFGQDTLDALFWTATEPRDRKREHFGVIFHFLVATIYIGAHSTIVLLQALTLNVAINSDNKGLLTIVISNNFVELKGAVFKKFDRNNLLQISCSDVRERFHICVLLFVVVIQTMKEYSWKRERFVILMPDCLLVLGTEVMIDWLKHAFITRFNDIPVDAYRDYTVLIASDLIMCKQKYAYSDHSDLVARRMGFIPMPLGVVIFRILSQSLTISSVLAVLALVCCFFCLLTFRVLNGIILLGKACDLIHNTQMQRSRNASGSLEKSTSKVGPSVFYPSTRNRGRTMSRESDFAQREMVETFVCKDVEDKVLNKDLTKEKNGKSSPAKRLMFLEEPLKTKQNAMEEEKLSPSEDESPPLTFLGESRSGLMANSMVNLASVGINQGVTDDKDGSIQKMDSSPDVSKDSSDVLFSPICKLVIREYGGSVVELPTSPMGLNPLCEEYNEEECCLSTSSLSMTQSCPCLDDIIKQSDNHLKIRSDNENKIILKQPILNEKN